MKIFKNKYSWSTSAHSKNLDGTENKAYIDVQFPKGKEPMGEAVEGKLIFKTPEKESECFLSSYKRKDGTLQIKLVIMPDKVKTTIEQMPLTGGDRDVTGHIADDNKVVIETDELPFY